MKLIRLHVGIMIFGNHLSFLYLCRKVIVLLYFEDLPCECLRFVSIRFV